MLYACSILYKTRLPFVIVFNKTDVVSHEFAAEWVSDFEAFQVCDVTDSFLSSPPFSSHSIVSWYCFLLPIPGSS